MKITVQLFKSKKNPTTIINKASGTLSERAFKLYTSFANIIRSQSDISCIKNIDDFNANYNDALEELIRVGYIVEDTIKGYEQELCYKFYENGTVSANDALEIKMNMMGDNYYVIREWKDRVEY